MDPNSVTALWLLGNAAFDNGDNAAALGYWQRAYPLLDGEPPMQDELGQMITQAGGKLPASPAALPPIMAAAPASRRGRAAPRRHRPESGGHRRAPPSWSRSPWPLR